MEYQESGSVMIIRSKSKDKHIYIGLWVNNENRAKQKHFNFAVTSNPNMTEEDFENVGGITGDLFIKTFSDIPFGIDDYVYWKGYGENKKYNIVSVTDGDVDENELSNTTFRNKSVKYIQLRRAG